MKFFYNINEFLQSAIQPFWGYLRGDGAKHLIVSAVLSALLNLFLPWCIAGLLVFLIGIVKEVIDAKSFIPQRWDVHDLICDTMGILIGLL